MPPQTRSSEKLYEEKNIVHETENFTTSNPTSEGREWKIRWPNVIRLALSYSGAFYGLYLALFRAMWSTILFAFALFVVSGLGLSAGAHRLWSHKSYKARLPLRLMLLVFNTIGYQLPILDWAQFHRAHHKFSDTDGDPTNVSRGLFFAYVGWMLVSEHPEAIAKSKTIDISDVLADPLVRFQKKYFEILVHLLCFILPTIIPTLWGESLWNGFFVAAILRYVYVLNFLFYLSSFSHKYGKRPYNRFICPTDSRNVSIFGFGEGLHNFHHTFPWDYRSSEKVDELYNFTTVFLNLMAKIGWAYDFKTVSVDVIKKRVKRTGDGSHPVWGRNVENDASDEEKQ